MYGLSAAKVLILLGKPPHRQSPCSDRRRRVVGTRGLKPREVVRSDWATPITAAATADPK